MAAERPGGPEPVLRRDVVVREVRAEGREPRGVREGDLGAGLPGEPGGVPVRRVGVVGDGDAGHAHAGGAAVGLDLEKRDGRREDDVVLGPSGAGEKRQQGEGEREAVGSHGECPGGVH